ncbi:hypothetical protein V8C37DRAFT_382029 [Trichoderma ceciliae]
MGRGHDDLLVLVLLLVLLLLVLLVLLQTRFGLPLGVSQNRLRCCRAKNLHRESVVAPSPASSAARAGPVSVALSCSALLCVSLLLVLAIGQHARRGSNKRICSRIINIGRPSLLLFSARVCCRTRAYLFRNTAACGDAMAASAATFWLAPS